MAVGGEIRRRPLCLINDIIVYVSREAKIFATAAVFILVLSLLSIGAKIYFSKNNKNTNIASASTASNTITTKTQWDSGTLVNIDSTTVDGSIELSTDPAQIDLLSLYNEDNDRVTATEFSAERVNVLDDDLGTTWHAIMDDGPPATPAFWVMDLGSTYSLTKISITPDSPACAIYVSTNNVDWTTLLNVAGCLDIYGVKEAEFTGDYRYVKVMIGGPKGPTEDPYPVYLKEVDVWRGGTSGTHTSAATQITDTNFYQWQTFSPTYTEPANTDISFKFRTSTDSSTWTAWTASQTVASGGSLDITELVTSSTGDPGSETFYKYIQVETTLSNTDSASTPVLSDYTIGYHTNVVPDAPTTGSVTIGS